MRAIVIATGHQTECAAFGDALPNILLPLVDRPFIQQVVEYLIDLGVTDFDFILSQAPEAIEALFGAGERWGSQFNFHLVKDAGNPYQLLKLICGNSSERIMLVHADRLAAISAAQLDAAPGPAVFCFAETEGSQTWTGWAAIDPDQLATFPPEHTRDRERLGAYLMELARTNGRLIAVSPPLSVANPERLLAAQDKVLRHEFTGLLLTGRESDPGVWLCRNVSLHPTARVVAPIFIGPNCRIGAGVRLGPNATIGSDSVLDKNSTVENSLVMPGSYVGEALELTGAIVNRNRLFNVQVGVAVSVADNFILGSLGDKHIGRFAASLLSRGAAVVLLVLTWPILLLTAALLKLFRRGPVVNRVTAVRLPAAVSDDEWPTFRLWSFRTLADQTAHARAAGWRDLLFTFLPGLLNVARGELHFVGVSPRTPDEVRQLPHDWLALYRRSKAGLITEAYVHQGASPSVDELFTAEAFYSVSSGLRHDLRLICMYLGRVAKDCFARPRERLAKTETNVPSVPSLPWKT
jgi:NDP-sugar pyrophosphorylase family protein/lipopolysaccharide/colanic/teichoic acid biosynthesis glycosyltransferase